MIPRRNIGRAISKALQEPRYAWRAARQRLRSYLSYRFGRGRSSPPETLSLFLTYRCNLRCKMCGQWGRVGSSKELPAEILRQELPLETIQSLIQEVKRFRPTITLFGGEPLLYADWPEVVSVAKQAGLRCNLITNGTLLEKHAETIVGRGVDEIIFSLDGPREIHDEMRSAPGTFDRAVAGFKKIAELREARGSRRPIVNISGVIYETNYRRLPEVVEAAIEMRAAAVTFHHLIFVHPETCEEMDALFRSKFGLTCPDWHGFARTTLPEIDVDALVDAINEMKRKKYPLPVSFYPNYTDAEVRQYYTAFDFVPQSYRDRCLSPWMVSYIFPDGSVRPCQSTNFSAGNVNDAPFAQIWNGEQFRDYRRAVKACQRFPVCTRCTEFYRF